jgi:hypothetical protein
MMDAFVACAFRSWFFFRLIWVVKPDLAIALSAGSGCKVNAAALECGRVGITWLPNMHLADGAKMAG